MVRASICAPNVWMSCGRYEERRLIVPEKRVGVANVAFELGEGFPLAENAGDLAQTADHPVAVAPILEGESSSHSIEL